MPSRALVVDVAVPAMVFLLMLVVGAGLTLDDFRRVGRHPRVIVGATLAQVVGLPLLGGLLVWTFDPPAALAAGLVLLTACPGGALSNVYTYLARAHTALSVTLTAVSSVVSVVTLPLAVRVGFQWLLADEARVTVPVLVTMGQLVALLLVPIALGMVGHAWWPTWVARHRRTFERASLFGVITIVSFVLATEAHVLAADFTAVAGLALMFSGLAMTAGWLVGRWLSPSPADHFTVMIEFGTRNLGIAVVVAVTLLGRPEFLAIGAVLFVVQAALALLSVAIYRRRTAGVTVT